MFKCIAMTHKGEQCKRNTKKKGLCHQHTKIKMNDTEKKVEDNDVEDHTDVEDNDVEEHTDVEDTDVEDDDVENHTDVEDNDVEDHTDVEDNDVEDHTDVEDTDVEDNDVEDHTDVEDNDVEDHTDVEDNEHKIIKNNTLKLIQSKIKLKFTPEFLKQFKTIKGNTQEVERNYISEIETILTELNLTYKKASSQGSKDFQNINNTDLNIEVKKTDSFNIMCNDTCPTEDIEYLIIFTGTKYVKKINIEPQFIFINGGVIRDKSPWIQEFQSELTDFKDKWCRGENKKKLEGFLRTYLRPTYQFDIKSLLK
jgi:hypothetical protein